MALHYVLLLGEEVIGYALIKRLSDKKILLTKMAVHPAYRRRRYANYILDQIEEKAKSSPNISYITLHVCESNEGAIKLYENKGFQIIERIEGYYEVTGNTKEDKVAIEMRLNL